MAVLEIVQSNLVEGTRGWVSARKGTGSSKGDVNAGSGEDGKTDVLGGEKVTVGDKVGAAFLTIFVLVSVTGGGVAMVW